MASSSPPLPPAPSLPPLTQGQKRRHYFIGLGVGLIPLIIFLVSIGLLSGNTNNQFSNNLTGIVLAALLYLIELIVTIIFLAIKQVRFTGYGLLTAFLASPIVAAIGCTVIPNLVHR